ncbi:MAG TPA: polyprenol monophosphomannose synthase [Acidimicrobiales bacterium]|nr:polyprenol monophosphomannose synthase [Acidimicrobiales bacterium]
MRVLVVLPTYNEAANIDTVLRRVNEAVPEADLLVVDDNSPDGTAKIAEETGKSIGGVEVLGRPGKQGLGSAYREGFAWGLGQGYDALVQMDSDLSHDPSSIPSLLAPLADGFDAVIGSRYVAGGSIPAWKWYRRLLSRGGNIYSSAMLGLRVADSTGGFRAYSAGILEQIDLETVRADSYGFQIEMTYRTIRAGGQVKEVPIRFVDRVEGISKMSMYTVVEALGLVTWWGFGRLFGQGRRARPAGKTRA